MSRYMRICGFAAEGLRGERKIYETFPVKELQDYWSSRPKYEQVSHKSPDFISGSSSGVPGAESASGSSSSANPDTGGQTYQEWLAQQKDEKEEAPPPPYTLEAEEAAAAAASVPAPATHATPITPVTPATSPNPVAAAAAIGAASNTTTSSYAPQTLHHVQTATSTYPGQASNHGPPTQPQTYPQTSYSSPFQSTSPAHTDANNVTQPHVVGHDPVGVLANEFGRQSISGETGGGRVSNASQPPLHPTHPAAKLNNAGAPYPGAPSITRPQSQQGYSAGGPGHAAHPGPRPSTTQPQRPQSQQGGGSAAGWSQPQSQQWPPQDWNVNNTPSGPNAGGANLSRPHTFSASSYNSGAANTRPTATTSGNAGRPNNSQPSSPLNQGAFPNHSPGPSSPFATAFPHASQPFPGGSGYPGHTPGPASGAYTSSYPWSGGPGASVPNSGTPSYHGQKPGSQPYNPAQGPQYSWGGPSTAPSTSGPMFPSAAPGGPPSTFPNAAVPSSGPPTAQMPSATPGGMPSPATSYTGGHGGPQFPGAASGASTNYFPGGVAGSSTYPGGSSYPGGPSYPVVRPTSGSGSAMPTPGPWMPAPAGSSRPTGSSGHNTPGSSSSPPAIPPRKLFFLTATTAVKRPLLSVTSVDLFVSAYLIYLSFYK